MDARKRMGRLGYLVLLVWFCLAVSPGTVPGQGSEPPPVTPPPLPIPTTPPSVCASDYCPTPIIHIPLPPGPCGPVVSSLDGTMVSTSVVCSRTETRLNGVPIPGSAQDYCWSESPDSVIETVNIKRVVTSTEKSYKCIGTPCPGSPPPDYFGCGTDVFFSCAFVEEVTSRSLLRDICPYAWVSFAGTTGGPGGGPGGGGVNQTLVIAGGIDSIAHQLNTAVTATNDLTTYTVFFTAQQGRNAQPVLEVSSVNSTITARLVHGQSKQLKGTFNLKLQSGDTVGEAVIRVAGPKNSEELKISMVKPEIRIVAERVTCGESSASLRALAQVHFREFPVDGHTVSLTPEVVSPQGATAQIDPASVTSTTVTTPGASFVVQGSGLTSIQVRATDQTVFQQGGAAEHPSVLSQDLMANARPVAKIRISPEPNEFGWICTDGPFKTVVLDGRGSSNPGGGALSYRWLMTTGPTDGGTEVLSKATGPVDLPVGATSIILEVTTPDGCKGMTTQLVQLSQGPRVTSRVQQPQLFCPTREQTLHATVEGGEAPVRVDWVLTGSGPRATGSRSFQGSDVTTGGLMPGTYSASAEATDARGCQSRSVSSFQVVNASPKIQTTHDGGPIQSGDTRVVELGSRVVLDASRSSDCENDRDRIALTYSWTGVAEAGTGASLAFTMNTTTHVFLTVKDADGGQDSAAYTLIPPVKKTKQVSIPEPSVSSTGADAAIPGVSPGRSNSQAFASTHKFSVPQCSVCGGCSGGGSGGDGGTGGVGDPVEVVSGAMFDIHQDAGWVVVGGSVSFRRAYFSNNLRAGQLGAGWTHTYERRLEDRGSGGAAEIDGYGQFLVFPAAPGGGWSSPTQGGATLRQEPDGSRIVRYQTGQTFTYRSDGRLAAMADPNGNTFRLQYSASNDLTEVIDPVGGVLRLEVADGLVRSVTQKSGEQVRYSYTPDRRLASVTDVRGHTTTYSYDAATGLLMKIQRPTGDLQEYTYDPQGRVVRVRLVGRDGQESVERLEYPSDRVRLYTNPTGQVTAYELDEEGRVVKQTDPDGAEQAMTYSASGRLLTWTDAQGQTQSWGYAADGQVESHRSPLGRVTRVERDANGLPAVIVNPDGTRIERQLDAAGNILAVKDALGRQTRYQLNSRGQVLQTIDPQNRVSSVVYDPQGQVGSETDPAGRVTTYQRDAMGRVVATTTPDGRTTRTEYCTCGQPSATIDALGRRTEYEYDEAGRLVATTLPGGARTTRTWARIGGHDVVVESRDAAGNVSRSGYDASGRMVSQTDSLGRTTTYTLDSNGRVIRVDQPGGGFTVSRYDAGGRVSEVENARGAVTRFVYDPDGRLLRTVLPDGTSSSQGYDTQGRVITRTRADGGVEQLVYDAAGQQIATVDPLGHVSRTEYTTSGSVSRVLDARDNATRFRYDSLDRLVETTNALGYRSTQGYDSAGRTELTSQANGAQIHYDYDLLDRVTQVTDPLGNSVRRAYDAQGNVVSVTDENGHSWSFTYDILGRKLTETDPNGKTTRYSYNAVGELTQTTFPDGTAWRYVRDVAGRVTERHLQKADGSDEDVERFGHDVVGNRISSENASVKVTSAFDLMDRETKRTITYKASGAQRELSFTYDVMGRRSTMLDSHGRALVYSYDQLSRPTAITVVEPQTGYCGLEKPFRTRTYGFVWDATSNLTQVDYPNGTRTRRTFDALSRLTGLVHERVDGAKTFTLQSFKYTRDAVGNITQMVNEQGETFKYQSDLKGQLVKALLPKNLIARLKAQNDAKGVKEDPEDGETPEEEAEERNLRAEDISWKYDPAGNRVEENIGGRVITASYSPANELLARGSVRYGYDERGNQIQKQYPSGQLQAFSYNVANQLVAFSKGQESKKKAQLKEVERYLYSPENERVSVEDVAGKKLTHFLWDGGRPIEEWRQIGHGAGKKDQGLLYARDLGGQLLDQVRYQRTPAGTIADADGGGSDDSDDEDDDPGPRSVKFRHLRFVYPDHLGSTSLVTNAQGRRLDRLVYSAWGQPLTGNFNRTRFGYTGHQREAATGNWYSLYRYLDPRAGRWTQLDPAGRLDGNHRYRYALNAPTRAIDPTGLVTIPGRLGVSIEATLQERPLEQGFFGPLYSALYAMTIKVPPGDDGSRYAVLQLARSWVGWFGHYRGGLATHGWFIDYNDRSSPYYEELPPLALWRGNSYPVHDVPGGQAGPPFEQGFEFQTLVIKKCSAGAVFIVGGVDWGFIYPGGDNHLKLGSPTPFARVNPDFPTAYLDFFYTKYLGVTAAPEYQALYEELLRN